MVTIRSWVKANDALVPVEQLTCRIPDENYIEGAIELSVGQKPILTREMIDYVDQLWAYLIRGLGEVVAGREFSTFYPDMPLEVVLRPQDGRVTILVDPQGRGAEASAAIDDLRVAMATAGTLFFERMRLLAPSNEAIYARYLSELAVLANR
jgi:hypothetical protein